MRPFYLKSGHDSVAAIYEPGTTPMAATAVLLVPPFGWDDQTSYRPRRDWSLALAEKGFANLRIDLPGTGDSSGSPRDFDVVGSWIAAIGTGVHWLRGAGARRVAVIALGSGGLLTLQAIADGAAIDDLVLWATPGTGHALIREIKAFSRLERSQTGAPADDVPEGAFSAGGHILTAETLSSLAPLDASALLRSAHPRRALLLGRDGTEPDRVLVAALEAAGTDTRTDPGRGWGAALEQPQSRCPSAIFDAVNAWLGEDSAPAAQLSGHLACTSAELCHSGKRIRETPAIFEAGGQQLFAVVAEPIDTPLADGAVILFNAGAIRRIGPNRMWTEAARRWAAAGIPVIRVDLEGIGDSSGDSSQYASDEGFSGKHLIEQARAALEFANEWQLPPRFVLGGLCSGAWWSFEVAVADPRVGAVMLLNPRMLGADTTSKGRRELRKLPRLLTRSGIRNMLREKHKGRRALNLLSFLARSPARLLQPANISGPRLIEKLRTLHHRGQKLHIGFSGDEPLYQELCAAPGLDELERLGVGLHRLPCQSHTLKPLASQRAAHAMMDEVVGQTLFCSAHQPTPMSVAEPVPAAR